MKVKALRSFSGALSMSRGEERDITDTVILDDLLKAGYVETAETAGNAATVTNGTQSDGGTEGVNPQMAAETNEEDIDETELMSGYLDEAELKKMTVPNLKALAKQMRLDDSGRKEELIARISAVKVELSADEGEDEKDSESSDVNEDQ